MGDYSSLYKYEKFEIIGDELVPLGIFSVDGNGTMPIVVKDDCDPQCGCPQPIYQWIQTEDTICVYVPPTPVSGKFRLTLSDSSTVSAECDSTSAITSGEVSSQYSGTVVSAEIGNCVNTIDGYAFSKCNLISSITIPDNITTINRRAFQNCSGLTNVTIGDGVIEIGYGVFAYCTSLTSITVNATTPPTLGGAVFNNTNNCPIYVPTESVETYKTASGWSDYASRIQAIQ